MTSIAESELEALPLEENPTETDPKLGEDGKRRRNSEDLMGSPNKRSQNFQIQTMVPWMKTTLIST